MPIEIKRTLTIFNVKTFAGINKSTDQLSNKIEDFNTQQGVKNLK